MCGIVGLYLKNAELQLQLGSMFQPMLVEMSSRGPDSAGVAIYRNPVDSGQTKFSLAHNDPDFSWETLGTELAATLQCSVSIKTVGTHCILVTDAKEAKVVRWLKNSQSAPDVLAEIRIVGSGQSIEIFKEVGPPETVYEQFNLSNASGTHMIGHTRMATESDVDIRSAHPYWAFPYNDISVVHNGQITNYWIMRRTMEREGHRFMSNCDSELLAVYTAYNLAHDFTLEESLKRSIDEIDGVFTYLVATKNQLGMAKDTMAAKPLVLYESDQLIAMASEEVAIRSILPQEIDTYDPYDEEVRVWQA